ncbi:hypothetical protein Tco_0719353 [Tanacetum coccineum]
MLANSVNFHKEVGHTTDECMHLKRQIEEMLKAGKLSHLIKELKQSKEKEPNKSKIAQQRIQTPNITPETMISFPPLGRRWTERAHSIEAKVRRHFDLVHRSSRRGLPL